MPRNPMIYRALLAVGGLIFAVLSARWIEEGDYHHPLTQRHHCGAWPPAIKDWSYTSRVRQPGDLANFDRWLQQHAGDVNRLFGAFCWAPLHSAARFGREDLAALLVARGADVRTVDEPAGYTALHVAAQYGQAAVATVLVARGADVNAATRYGRTPLHEAASGLGATSDLEGRLEVAKLLIARGADVNARERGSGRTPLDEAAASSNNRANTERMTELLVAAGAAPRPADSRRTRR
jgi:ankyrin repeat protein